jgi:cytochrome c-type biogenesis protein
VSAALLAFVAGIASFATPCVLPLVPAYLSAIGARSGGPRQALAAAVPFVIGFSAVFVALGVVAGGLGAALADYRVQIAQFGGIVIVAMGFVMMGLLRIDALERTLQPGIEPARSSGSALLLGGAFGLGWSPCMGPVLASILAVAASGGAEVAEAAGLLAVYAAGLAVPFLVASLALGRAMGAFRALRDHYAAVRLVSGVVLVGAGLLVFFDRVYVLNAWVARAL